MSWPPQGDQIGPEHRGTVSVVIAAAALVAAWLVVTALGAFLLTMLAVPPIDTVAPASVCLAAPAATSCRLRTLSPAALAQTLEKHKRWLESGETGLGRADLSCVRLAGVDLRARDLRRAKFIDADLSGANLERALLHGADLARANLRASVLRGAVVDGADLEGADLAAARADKLSLRATRLSAANLEGATLADATLTEEAKLTGTCLRNANLSRADLTDADLTDADLNGADLTAAVLAKARLDRATLNNAIFTRADLSDTSWEKSTVEAAVFEPKTLASPEELAVVRDLERLRFKRSPLALQLVRDQLRGRGFREEARRITYAINESLTSYQLRPAASWRERFEARTRQLSLGWTTCYGLCPERSLLVILGAVALCALLYLVPLIRKSGAGICKESSAPGTAKAERLDLRAVMRGYGSFRGWLYVFGVAWYFSFLSALAIGRQQVHATIWITRIQPGDTSLRPTGWVKSVSGMQALVSVLFGALAAGAYLGRLLD